MSRYCRKDEIDDNKQDSNASKLETQLAIVNLDLIIMNSTTIQITNITVQSIGIMLNSIDPAKASQNSDIPAENDGSHQILAGNSLTVELQRVNVDQLDNLRYLKQITYA